MATQITNLARNTFPSLTKTMFKHVTYNVHRCLYTPNSLGIDGYINSREYVKNQFLSVDNLFREKMQDTVNNTEAERLIFTEDLKNMLHLIKKDPQDLDLLTKMIKKYNTQNKLRFGSFVFGTITMRAYYYLDEPDLALQIIRDPELPGFFDQVTTYQIIMDLLYNHEKYTEIRELYNDLQNKCINGQPHPSNPFILMTAACYKQNTPESFDYCLQVLKDSQAKGNHTPRRAIMYLAALALNQNDPQTALEVLSLARNPNYIAIRCLKIECYTKLKRSEEIIVYLRHSLQLDRSTIKLSYFSDTIEKIESFISENQSENKDLEQIIKQIKQQDFVQSGTLVKHLDTEIQSNKNDRNRLMHKNFNRNKYSNRISFPEIRGVA